MTILKSARANLDMEQVLGNFLRFGVITAGVVVLAGGILFLLRHASEIPDYKVFHGAPIEFRNITGIIKQTLAVHARGIIQLGCLLLIATPVIRVVLSVYGFARQRDWTYVAITLVVLAVLLYGLSGTFS